METDESSPREIPPSWKAELSLRSKMTNHLCESNMLYSLSFEHIKQQLCFCTCWLHMPLEKTNKRCVVTFWLFHVFGKSNQIEWCPWGMAPSWRRNRPSPSKCPKASVFDRMTFHCFKNVKHTLRSLKFLILLELIDEFFKFVKFLKCLKFLGKWNELQLHEGNWLDWLSKQPPNQIARQFISRHVAGWMAGGWADGWVDGWRMIADWASSQPSAKPDPASLVFLSFESV